MTDRTKAGISRKYRVPKALAYPRIVTCGFDPLVSEREGRFRMLMSTQGFDQINVLIPIGTAIAKTQRAIVIEIVFKVSDDSWSVNHSALSAVSTTQYIATRDKAVLKQNPIQKVAEPTYDAVPL